MQFHQQEHQLQSYDKVNALRLKFNRVEYSDQIDGFNVFDKSNIGMTTFMQK